MNVVDSCARSGNRNAAAGCPATSTETPSGDLTRPTRSGSPAEASLPHPVRHDHARSRPLRNGLVRLTGAAQRRDPKQAEELGGILAAEEAFGLARSGQRRRRSEQTPPCPRRRPRRSLPRDERSRDSPRAGAHGPRSPGRPGGPSPAGRARGYAKGVRRTNPRGRTRPLLRRYRTRRSGAWSP